MLNNNYTWVIVYYFSQLSSKFSNRINPLRAKLKGKEYFSGISSKAIINSLSAMHRAGSSFS